jgi:hypothetical protein
VLVADISMHLLEALEKGDRRGVGAGAPAPSVGEPVE